MDFWDLPIDFAQKMNVEQGMGILRLIDWIIMAPCLFGLCISEWNQRIGRGYMPRKIPPAFGTVMRSVEIYALLLAPQNGR